MQIPDLEARLDTVDWNFDKTAPRQNLHTIHPYPARFIPQIPHHLIRLLHPGDDSVILDPFCGSGTTLVEALRVGINVWGIDLNPIACLISKVKTTPLSIDFRHVVTQIITNIQNRMDEDVIVPTIPNLNHWFDQDVQKVVSVIVDEINQIADLTIRDALRLTLSSILVKVSYQDSDTRYAAVHRMVTREDVIKEFLRASNKVWQSLYAEYNNFFRLQATATILNQDILSVTPTDLPDNIGLIITSPPYPNAYEYWLYHKYRMYWLGMNPTAVKQREIGARAHYFTKHPQSEIDFEAQMTVCFELFAQRMHRNGIACFVVGRSIIHGREIDNVALLQRASAPFGFDVISIISREIPKTRKAINPLHGNIAKESILVLRLK